ncbi:uncharacterized protein LOC123711692 [Pieris brassicae]|uniref:uncharacterized protein LOC123711692 n=1 Tax=Pieris brassicae TaxID=7116 RepID=UPI001E65EE7B|nr:uncharacterized protein LOC123711692 [Pieris brassicae]
MNGDVEVEAPRPRPLSAGLWTIFSWLRRSERSSSSESISSVGSDRTAASFDFLPPIYYPNSQAPITLPLNSPTDSYKRRVQERNLRRQRERGVTLHRKYGLWREEGGYDRFSLPPANKNIGESGGNQRCRRAASECFHRRAAYVPGKRHAPPPPTFVTTSLPRSYKRKRPAPKPPLKAIAENKENIEINNNDTLLRTLPSSDNSTKENIVNNVQGTSSNSSKIIFIPQLPSTETDKASDKPRKEIKLRTEKSFLKQIFENKKRHSADISHVKFLPSISELDKQAAEIIENNKLTHNYTYLEDNNLMNEEHAINSNSEKMWMCTKCLRKYNTSIKSCVYCVPKENELTKIINSQCKASSSSTQTELSRQLSKDVEEKKKLRKILKEMKDSLPKKQSQKKTKHTINFEVNNESNETPTLRIGTTVNENKEEPLAHNKLQKLNQEPSTSAALSTGNHSNNKRHTFIDEKTNNSLEGNSESLIRAIITSNNLKKPLVEVKPNEDYVSNTKAAAISKSREVPKEISLKFTHDNLPASNNNQLKLFENIDRNQAIKENKITTNTNSGLSTHTPLSISSLLNPIYQPKATTSTQCFQVASKTNLNTTLKTEVLLNSDVTFLQLKSVTKTPAKDLNNTNTEKVKFKKEPTNASSNQMKLDPKTVSQIIKKSIEQKEKQLQENEAKIEAVKIGEYIKRRELINQLESSIAKGDETAAAEAASKLAKLRLSCSVLSYSSQIVAGPSTSGITIPKQEKLMNKDNVDPQENKTFVVSEGLRKINKNNTNNSKTEAVQQIDDHKDAMNDIIPIEVWIEDKIAARGPVRLNISQRSTVADLKREALSYLGIEIRLQRWIVGKSLCTDDNMPIISLAGTAFDAPFYLCLVESDENKASKTEASSLVKLGEFYTELIKLEQQALILNAENFECGVCLEECAVGDGAVLRDCLHTFCRGCLSDAVRHCEEPIISCPAVGCPGVLQDREIRALLSAEDYDKWLARGLAVAESGTRNNFHCRTPDCSGWAFCEPGVRVFPCPVCKKKNCIPCQALHDGETCEQYQKKLCEVTADNTDAGTQALLDSLISRGEALRCPECQAIITKKWGCDWVKCSACKTEICWVTKGRRWGPGGRGDTSGGCKCGVEGKKCHPTCSYCH